ncbi:uncharacterized protein LOC114353851 [Ostrinia furnacalis]|uniref:uncharacterized protein LOC114353851 n=1 Tax=Ostrinia furnacalis TaxID=93504 RepID=UPI001038D305|nr:uncharacterized protein LOC114353851 [Ostrinia furnacalis]XP_028161777.1 uncharacterized protein LOC114353851 [Ostrinia furnacalis]
MQKKYFFFCIVATTLALPQRGKHDLTPSASTDSQELHSLVDQIFGPDRVKPSPLASSTSSPSDDSGTTPDLEAALDKIFGPAEEKPKKPSPLASSASSCGDDTETKPDLEAQIFNPDDGEKTEAPSQVVPSPPPPIVDGFVGTGEECDLLGRTGICVKAPMQKGSLTRRQ